MIIHPAAINRRCETCPGVLFAVAAVTVTAPRLALGLLGCADRAGDHRDAAGAVAVGCLCVQRHWGWSICAVRAEDLVASGAMLSGAQRPSASDRRGYPVHRGKGQWASPPRFPNPGNRVGSQRCFALARKTAGRGLRPRSPRLATLGESENRSLEAARPIGALPWPTRPQDRPGIEAADRRAERLPKPLEGKELMAINILIFVALRASQPSGAEDPPAPATLGGNPTRTRDKTWYCNGAAYGGNAPRPSARARVSAMPSAEEVDPTGGEATNEASEEPCRAMEIG